MSEEPKYLLTIYDIVYLHGLIGFGGGAWNEFLKEHVNKERTCFIEGFKDDFLGARWTLSCGHEVEGYTKPDYCSTCGAKVVKE